MPSTPQKILRVAILENSTVVEERLLRRRQTVCIGQDVANTLVVPAAGLPASHPLFELRGGRFHLRLAPEMSGGVKVDGGLMDVQALVAAGLAEVDADGQAHVPLSDRSRGRVRLGEITVLFQFVTPPPAPSRAQLPALQRRFITATDRPFFATLLASLVVQVAAVAFLVTRDYPVAPRSLDDIEGRFINVVYTPVPAPVVKAPPSVAPKPIKPDDAPEPTQVARRDPPRAAPKSTPPGQPISERRKAAIRKNSALVLLGAEGKNGAQIVDDLLSQGADMAALRGAFGPATGRLAVNEDDNDPRRRTIDTEGSLADLGTGLFPAKGPRPTAPVRTGVKREKAIGQVRTRAVRDADVISTGPVDTRAIARVIRRRKNQIMRCYTQRLKLRNDLAGKVAVRFTIQPSGRAAAVKVIGNSSGDDSLGKCVANTIKRWKFPRSADSVTVDYPFIFTPAK